jgi:hypothetical protein
MKRENIVKWLGKRSASGPLAVSWPAMASKFVPNTAFQRLLSPTEQRLYSGDDFTKAFIPVAVALKTWLNWLT